MGYMTRGSERLDRILDWWRQGWSTDEIDKELEQRRERGRRRYEQGLRKGEASERNAIEALRELPYVTLIKQARRGGRWDCQLKDLVVWTACLGEKPVYIQVKSSEARVNLFFDDVRLRYGLEGKEVEAWMKSRRFIVLNGALETDQIVANFERQLEEIVRSHSADDE